MVLLRNVFIIFSVTAYFWPSLFYSLLSYAGCCSLFAAVRLSTLLQHQGVLIHGWNSYAVLEYYKTTVTSEAKSLTDELQASRFSQLFPKW